MSVDPRAYWIWLQHCVGAGSSKPVRILMQYSSIKEFYEAGEREWKKMGIFSPRELKAFSDCSLEVSLKILQDCSRKGQTVTTPDMPEYPEALRQIANPPCALYVKGSLPDFSEVPVIAVVGTRDATLTGRMTALHLSAELAKVGVIVVSGGAKGIDSAAHRGVLQVSGCTVCVLGCGIDYPYLMENEPMRQSICKGGALISEYPPNTPPTKMSFPVRNRIISGISDGVVVVEAAGKSGSLITAELAGEQGRDVFAVPGSVDNKVGRGVNNLIKTGAKAVTEVKDILEEYFSRYPGTMKQYYRIKKEWTPVEEENNFVEESGLEKGNNPKAEGNDTLLSSQEEDKKVVPKRRELPEECSSEMRKIYEVLKETPISLEEVEQQTGLTVKEIFPAVTRLELLGCIRQYRGRRYSL